MRARNRDGFGILLRVTRALWALLLYLRKIPKPSLLLEFGGVLTRYTRYVGLCVLRR